MTKRTFQNFIIQTHKGAKTIDLNVLRKIRILSLIALYSGLLLSCIYFALYGLGFIPLDQARPWTIIGIALLIVGLVSHSVCSMYRAPKLNRVRIAALLLLLLSMSLGGLCFLIKINFVILTLFALAIAAMFASMFLYTFIGGISLKAPKVTCPACDHVTKVLGLRDRCGRCAAVLSLDPKDQPQKKAAPAARALP